jgi:putative MATE family efflux protein
MVASMFLNDVLHLVNLFFVGRLGTAHVAGLTMSNVFLEIFFTLAMGISTGTVAMVARHIGANKQEEAHNIVVQAIFIALLLSLVMTFLGVFLSEWAMGMMGTRGEVRSLGATYFRIIALGGIFIFVPFTLNSALRGAGDAITPMKIMVVSNLLNIFLSPCLIFGLSVFPRLEMAGAAWASVISRGVGMVLTGYVFLSGISYFRLGLRNIRLDIPVMGTLVRIGAFGSLQMVFRNISALFIARLVATFGVTAMAAYGIVIRLRSSVLLLGLALGNTGATLVGQNLGAGKSERAAKTGWAIAGMYSIFMVAITILFIVFARELISLFNRGPAVIEEGALFLRLFSATFIFLAFSSVLGRSITGAGDTFSPMCITGVSLLGLRIPLCYIFSLKWGVLGIWYGMAVSNIFQGIAFSAWYYAGRWKNVVID